MMIESDLRQKVDQFIQKLVEDDQRKAFLVPDLPPLNIPISHMTPLQKQSLYYWCEPDNLTYVYIQLKDAQHKTYNANYLEMGQQLAEDIFVSSIESASGWCTEQQKEKIEQWIDQHAEFQHVHLENMEDYGVVMSTAPWSNVMTLSIALLMIAISSLVLVFWSILLGCFLMAIGMIGIFYLHQQDQRAQQKLDIQMWKGTLMSRMESYLEHQIKLEMQKTYHLADESEQQMQDDNVLAYELPEELKKMLSSLEHHMFVEVEDEQGNKELKSLVHYQQQHKHKGMVMSA